MLCSTRCMAAQLLCSELLRAAHARDTPFQVLLASHPLRRTAAYTSSPAQYEQIQSRNLLPALSAARRRFHSPRVVGVKAKANSASNFSYPGSGERERGPTRLPAVARTRRCNGLVDSLRQAENDARMDVRRQCRGLSAVGLCRTDELSLLMLRVGARSLPFVMRTCILGNDGRGTRNEEEVVTPGRRRWAGISCYSGIYLVDRTM
ncbi:uncharacterized protein B0H18DRAFT_352991 [Fomitopsis serialis]|uniref:uncharacterized protein n=1 Tax=Fomitopsis serialis TaxID=139415 RepID=UPI0020080F49|nr:uncharacterized protein B0H18DRAFT_352878 [Neoantrodia serialis]XP_047893539.1 uncharacterized protein B0H18DRAFT_352991 [Neoantrodia serialis]KAH9926186.1 hypothetical protein B0H18DRAFT_352878 [Neoantrodia serialis]KAH9926188.1 hypothetical protein B0H18DRAFT_352991 [Neoantrodia serialis]